MQSDSRPTPAIPEVNLGSSEPLIPVGTTSNEIWDESHPLYGQAAGCLVIEIRGTHGVG